MKKTLVLILLLLSANICLSEKSITANCDFQVAPNSLYYIYNPCIKPSQLRNDPLKINIQESKKQTRFIITEAFADDVEITATIIEKKAYLVFYTVENDNILYMANVWPKLKTQSYGPIYSESTEIKKETYETFKADFYYFNWLFITGYDDKKGSAKVEIAKVYKPEGITFIIKMVFQDLKTVIYKGHLEGAVSFSTYD